MSTRFASRFSLAILIVLTTGPMARAIDWTGATDTDWFTGGNWSSPFAVPGSTTDVNIGPGTNGNPLISAGVANVGILDIGYSGGSGVLNITGGSLTLGGADDMLVQDTTAGPNTRHGNPYGGHSQCPGLVEDWYRPGTRLGALHAQRAWCRTEFVGQRLCRLGART